ncbi:NTP transferase domain-containing protein [Pelagibacterales bacterium SAG-MED38]|nr:NTP transferase domain-containing protein [Pelagibacterales bacterium SAG-MED38]
MKAIILCAGRGSRTGLNYPKCIHKFDNGKNLISRNIENLKNCGFKNTDIIFATGYAEKIIKKKTANKFKYIKNSKFSSTNMVYSFNEVLKKIKSDDVIIIYADIIYNINALKKIMISKKDIVTLVDSDWLQKWKLKPDYKNDFESLKIKNNKIISLGNKTKNIKNIDGRFVGITKFSKKMIKLIKLKKVIVNELEKNKKLDFTGFLMKLIQKNYDINVIINKIIWFEFDTKKDFEIYKKIRNKI